uniref:Small ribosomal subunit protein uS3c n=1 Tax=Phacus orbicularis TaxID=158829 RepID=A0A182B0X1_9EUGL|nr:ribosomal protein S3 [Phacus orbicularis]
MGQKVNPIGFRLGISNKEHDSFWYADSKNYSKLVKQDLFIRKFLQKKFSFTFIHKIVLKTKYNDCLIILSLVKNESFSKTDFISGISKELQKNLFVKFGSNLASLNIVEPSNLNTSAGYLADFIKAQLEKRVAFRKAIKNCLIKVQQEDTKLKGIKIQLAGRLNGAEIARTEWVREGRIPLNTLMANIDYSYSRAQTIYGVIGIKIWVYVRFVFV